MLPEEHENEDFFLLPDELARAVYDTVLYTFCHESYERLSFEKFQALCNALSWQVPEVEREPDLTGGELFVPVLAPRHNRKLCKIRPSRPPPPRFDGHTQMKVEEVHQQVYLKRLKRNRRTNLYVVQIVRNAFQNKLLEIIQRRVRCWVRRAAQGARQGVVQGPVQGIAEEATQGAVQRRALMEEDKHTG